MQIWIEKIKGDQFCVINYDIFHFTILRMSGTRIDDILLRIINCRLNTNQCWGSVTFWCGSGSGDPYL
jgi:hypothetical protein